MAVLHSLVTRQWLGPQAWWRPLREALASGLGLGGVCLAWPAVVWLLVFLCFGARWSCRECSSLFVTVVSLIFMFSLWCVGCVEREPLCGSDFYVFLY